MKTPMEKYQNDVAYKTFVDMLVDVIIKCQYTPSEIREMSLFACILYEQHHTKPLIVFKNNTLEIEEKP